MRSAVTFLIICLILLLQVTFMFIVNKKSVQMLSEYPLVDCSEIKEFYGPNLQRFGILQWWDVSHGINMD
jgi:hypothetical protein